MEIVNFFVIFFGVEDYVKVLVEYVYKVEDKLDVYFIFLVEVFLVSVIDEEMFEFCFFICNIFFFVFVFIIFKYIFKIFCKFFICFYEVF